MRLHRLIYYSSMSLDLRVGDFAAQIHEILVSARRNNIMTDITGMLLYHSRHFIQIMEGSRVELSRTYRRVSYDPRHTRQVLMEVREIEMRSFTDWSMAFIDMRDIPTPDLLRYAPSRWLELDAMPAEAVLKLARELRPKAAIHDDLTASDEDIPEMRDDRNWWGSKDLQLPSPPSPPITMNMTPETEKAAVAIKDAALIDV